MSVDVSVVLATHNRSARLADLLRALEAQTLPADRFEIVVVDDASSDDTAEVLTEARRRSDHLRTLRTPGDRPSGQAIARDIGWRAAAGPVIAFTDDDCRPAAGWLESALAALERAERTFVQGKTVPEPDEAARARPPSHTIDIPRIDPSYQTCNVFYPREALEAVDGFDLESFGSAPMGEDADLAWRVIGSGWRPVFCGEAETAHAVHEMSWGEAMTRARRIGRSAVSLDRHPGFREQRLHHGVFLKRIHVWLAGLILAAVIPRRMWPLKLVLARSYLRSLLSRVRQSEAGAWSAVAFLVVDLTEMTSLFAEGARRNRFFL